MTIDKSNILLTVFHAASCRVLDGSRPFDCAIVELRSHCCSSRRNDQVVHRKKKGYSIKKRHSFNCVSDKRESAGAERTNWNYDVDQI